MIQHIIPLLLVIFFVGYILFPIFKTVDTSLLSDTGTLSLKHYSDLFTLPSSRIPLLHSIILGLLSILVCGTIGTLLAFLIHFFDFPWKRLIDTLLLIPMIMPGLIIVYAFVQLYGESGMVTKAIQLLFHMEKAPFALSGLPGILIVHGYTQYVYFYITVSIAIQHMDQSVIEVARSLGASRSKILFSIILPFLKPALLAACAITFITGAGSFTAPSIIGGNFKVLTTQILLSKANNYMAVAATQVSVLTLLSLLFFMIFRFYEAKSRFATSVRGMAFQPVQIDRRSIRLLLRAFAICLILSILLPIVAIIVVSLAPSRIWMVHYFPTEFTLENYREIATKIRNIQPFLNSTGMAFLAGIMGLIIALPASFYIVKSDTRWKWLLEILAMLPWAIPASAIAINLINAFNVRSLFSGNRILVGTALLLPLGYFIKSLPVMVKTLNISFASLNDSYMEASRNLGATNFQTFRKITVPMLLPAILAGFLLMFIRSIGEYTISVFLYTITNKPMSIAMVNAVFEYNIGLAMAYGTLLLILTFLLSFIISLFFAKALR